MAGSHSNSFLRRARLRPARVGLALAGALACLAAAAPSLPATAAPVVPAGYRLAASEAVGPGVEHQTLRLDDPPQDVHVARLAPGLAVRLLPVLGHDALANPSAGLETTSSMCARVRCLAAVNGDFFDGAGRPVGAVVAGGELVASPAVDHILLVIDGEGTPHLRRKLDWSAGLTTADGRSVRAQAVNRAPAADGVTLYSGRWGPSTRTDAGTVELLLQLPPTAGVPLPTGPTPVLVVGLHTGGDAPIPPGHLALSGTGAAGQALSDLAGAAAGSLALLDVSVGGTISAIGGSPQLLQDRELAYPTGRADPYTQERRSRTMVGITDGLGIVLVTVDRSATSSGLTLLEAANLMRELGAVHAMNLDGGGSTSFVTAGGLRNVPSAGSERAVAMALTVMPAPPQTVTAVLEQVVSGLRALLGPAS